MPQKGSYMSEFLFAIHRPKELFLLLLNGEAIRVIYNLDGAYEDFRYSALAVAPVWLVLQALEGYSTAAEHVPEVPVIW